VGEGAMKLKGSQVGLVVSELCIGLMMMMMMHELLSCHKVQGTAPEQTECSRLFGAGIW